MKLGGFATSVARFRADSDRANLNCNEDPSNSKSEQDEISSLGITQVWPPVYPMKTYKNLYKKLCSLENLNLAFRKAKKRKTKKYYVQEFEKNLEEELNKLHNELTTLTYEPKLLKRFIIRDPKTREIHASDFRDRVVYHALVNILEPIYEKIFIYDSYASRLGKGTHKAVERFDYFKRKVARNGKLIRKPNNKNSVIGYVFKADIKHYFETVDHDILLGILRRKVKDENVIQLVKKILDNFHTKIKSKGMPLGNLTSQFFANVYLNELDYFVKHKLKAKYYMRYVDDFVILHNSKSQPEEWKEKINRFLKENLKLELHPDKSRIVSLSRGIDLIGFRNFYYFKLLRKRSIRKMEYKIKLFNEGKLSYGKLVESFDGWCAYAKWANNYKLKTEFSRMIVLN